MLSTDGNLRVSEDIVPNQQLLNEQSRNDDRNDGDDENQMEDAGDEDYVGQLRSLLDKWTDTQFYYEIFKDSFVSKYSTPADANPVLANLRQQQSENDGAGFVDMEDLTTMHGRDDLRKLVLGQPRNMEVELNYRKELFSRLKFNYLEQETKEKCLKRVLDIPARFATSMDVADTESVIKERKDILKGNKATTEELKQQLVTVIDSVCPMSEMVRDKSRTLAELADEVAELERLERQAKQEENREIDTSELQLLEKERDELFRQVESLRSTVTDLTEKVSINEFQRDAMEEEVRRVLRPRLEETEASAAEALRLASLKDPSAEELSKWYRNSTALLRSLLNLESMKLLNATDLEILFRIPRFAPPLVDGSRQEKREDLVYAMVLAINPAYGRMLSLERKVEAELYECTASTQADDSSSSTCTTYTYDRNRPLNNIPTEDILDYANDTDAPSSSAIPSYHRRRRSSSSFSTASSRSLRRLDKLDEVLPFVIRNVARRIACFVFREGEMKELQQQGQGRKRMRRGSASHGETSIAGRGGSDNYDGVICGDVMYDAGAGEVGWNVEVDCSRGDVDMRIGGNDGVRRGRTRLRFSVAVKLDNDYPCHPSCMEVVGVSVKAVETATGEAGDEDESDSMIAECLQRRIQRAGLKTVTEVMEAMKAWDLDPDKMRDESAAESHGDVTMMM
ncbi:hypothetical protein HK102_001195 [Quaeritorhiza haematococci]|nr:hypothetical protein HK102_001195 [Quaeritorhiza haematococci]